MFWGWGRKSIMRQLDANTAVQRSYRYLHLMFLFTVAWGYDYSIATLTPQGWAQRPLARQDAVQILGGQDLEPGVWQRFSLVIGLAALLVFGMVRALLV
jgi:hypothetical protein